MKIYFQYNSKKILSGLIIILCLTFFSCNSPLEVPANRDIKIKDNPYINPLVKFKPNYTNLDFVHPDSILTFSIKVENNQSITYPISEYHLFFGNINFRIIDKLIPIILSPAGMDGSEADIKIQFTAKNPGYFNDTLFVNNLNYPKAIFEAKVPYIYVNDFPSIKISSGETLTFSLTFTNLSSNDALIKSASISQNSSNFSLENIFPINLARNSEVLIPFKFTSATPGLYQTEFTFEIESVTQKSLIDKVSKITIISE